jgi:hypothetical protein
MISAGNLPLDDAAMTPVTPGIEIERFKPVLLRLFAVSWWLLVLGGVTLAISLPWVTLDPDVYFYTNTIFWLYVWSLVSWIQPDPDRAYTVAITVTQPVIIAIHLVLCALPPYAAMTVIRLIAIGRWRFGPRW